MKRLWELAALCFEGVTGERIRAIRKQATLSASLETGCVFIVGGFQCAAENDPGCDPPNGLVVMKGCVEEDSLAPRVLAETWSGPKIVGALNGFDSNKVNRALSRLKICAEN